VGFFYFAIIESYCNSVNEKKTLWGRAFPSLGAQKHRDNLDSFVQLYLNAQLADPTSRLICLRAVATKGEYQN
jgi:hypothetical protein